MAAIFDPADVSIDLALAGHPSPLLVRNASVEMIDGDGGMILLASPRAEYHHHQRLVLRPGERLLVYTDGATELDDVAKGMGESRFLAAAAASVLGGPVGALGRLGDDLWQGGGRRDDTTLVLVSRLGGRNPLAVDRNLSGTKV